MRTLFYIGLVCWMLFDVANIYFIMPLPGSQEMNSLNFAYFLYSMRWTFRFFFITMIILGLQSAFQASKWLAIISLLVSVSVFYFTQFQMAAERNFYQPSQLEMKDVKSNIVPIDRLVLGVFHRGVAKAYPIQFIGYHHQVRDSIGDKPVMITYCTVCRTGKVYKPIVEGKTENFRLVGMDHYNAMFEDKTTKSWWRQATGEAVAGKLKGIQLPEIPALQVSLANWIKLYPGTLIMQPDKKFQVEYDSMKTYELGRLTGRLTRRDTMSWMDKSWVVGVIIGNVQKAYDWNMLLKKRIIYDNLNNQSIVIILASDDQSFMVLEKVNKQQTFSISNDTLISLDNQYTFFGVSLDKNKSDLKKFTAYQEYWHSWKTFHPATMR